MESCSVVVAKIWDGANFFRVHVKSRDLSAAWEAVEFVAGLGPEQRDVLVGSPGAISKPQLTEDSWQAALALAETDPSLKGSILVRLCLGPPAVAAVAPFQDDEGASEADAVAAKHSASRHDGTNPPLRTQHRKVQLLNPIWLPMLLPRSPSKAVVLECRSRGATLRVCDDGGLDAQGCAGPRATFVARCVRTTPEGSQVLTLRSAAGLGLLRSAEGDPAVAASAPGAGGRLLRCSPGDSDGDEGGEHCEWEVVTAVLPNTFATARHLHSNGHTTYGVALRLASTGEFLEVDEAGRAVLVPAASRDEEQKAEVLLFRYQPRYDEAWKEDRQYEGKRRWVTSMDPNFYTFEDFVAMARRPHVKAIPFGESGIEAAKLFWATSVEEDASEDRARAAMHLTKAMWQQQKFSARDRRQYSFSEMLAFVESRGLRRSHTETDVEMVARRFGWLPEGLRSSEEHSDRSADASQD